MSRPELPRAIEAYAVEARLTWTGGSFEPGVRVEVGASGRIESVGPTSETAPGSGSPILRLPDSALLPGFVNAHSHAFQRGLRGRGESFPAGAGSFWSWREAMYGLVAELTPESLHDVSLRAYREMRAAGITTVGEFHYLHHDDPESLDGALDAVILGAAAAAGIRLVLLQAYYCTGGVGRPLAAGQRRFATPSPAAYWERMDALGPRLDPELQSLGAVAHSIRAVPLDDLVPLHAEARRRGLPFHMHVEEQRQEIEECRAAYGASPMELILGRLDLSPGERSAGLTAVHCTHTPAEQLDRFVAAGGSICLCPLTEANLGDGIPALRDAALGTDPPPGLSLGTDSNARISMLEEMRWLEYGQRLAGERRGALTDRRGEVAPRLLAAATVGGARALGVSAGTIAAGQHADLAALDLTHPALAPSLEGPSPDQLLAALIFGAGDAVVQATCVGGRWDPLPGTF